MNYSEASDALLDELTQLELRIARRADELAHAAGPGGGLLRWWLQAEAEILADIPALRHLVQASASMLHPSRDAA